MTVIIDVPYSPCSLNQLYGRHWTYGMKEKKLWMDYLFKLTQPIQRGLLMNWGREKRKVRVDIAIYHSRMFDRANLFGACKPIEDAIVKLEWAHDDRDAYMNTSIKQFKSKRTEQHTCIRIWEELS